MKTRALCVGGQLRKIGRAVNACGTMAARRTTQTSATPVASARGRVAGLRSTAAAAAGARARARIVMTSIHALAPAV
eukprot:5234115-Alexandrium_andersonii.AAC.1